MQNKLIEDDFIKRESNPENWKLDLTKYNDLSRKEILNKLVDYMETVMGEMAITNRYKFTFRVNGQWYSKPLTPELWHTLLEKLKNGSLIYDIDNKPPEYFYEKGGEELPEWSIYDAIGVNKSHEYDFMRKENSGSFFQYLLKEPLQDLDLSRYQIFSSLTKGKNDLTDCCFIYALKQTGLFDEDVLNKMRMRINLRTQHQHHLNLLCKEFNIKVIVKDIDLSLKDKTYNAKVMVNGKRQRFLGNENGVEVKMCLYENHYFLHERTKYSAYFINHIEDFIRDGQLIPNYNIKTSHGERDYIMSDLLIIALMKKGYFKPITYNEFSVLKTVFYNDLDFKDITDLEYNTEMCTKLIEPPKLKVSNKDSERVKGRAQKGVKEVKPTYWYADFEADTSGDIHTPYMCCVYSLSVVIKK